MTWWHATRIAILLDNWRWERLAHQWSSGNRDLLMLNYLMLLLHMLNYLLSTLVYRAVIMSNYFDVGCITFKVYVSGGRTNSSSAQSQRAKSRQAWPQLHPLFITPSFSVTLPLSVLSSSVSQQHQLIPSGSLLELVRGLQKKSSASYFLGGNSQYSLASPGHAGGFWEL